MNALLSSYLPVVIFIAVALVEQYGDGGRPPLGLVPPTFLAQFVLISSKECGGSPAAMAARR